MSVVSSERYLYITFDSIMYAVTDRLQDPCKWLGSFGPKCTISDKSKMAACINRLGDLKKAVIEYKTLENQASL